MTGSALSVIGEFVLQGVPWRQVHASCNSREQEELHRLLKGIVLIVNADYKDATRGTSDFLRAVYGRFFYQVVVISQTDIPDIGVEGGWPVSCHLFSAG